MGHISPLYIITGLLFVQYYNFIPTSAYLVRYDSSYRTGTERYLSYAPQITYYNHMNNAWYGIDRSLLFIGILSSSAPPSLS